MTFEALEEGVQGQPVELYVFRRGLSETYYLTSHDEDILYDSNTYLSVQIRRDTIEVNQEMERQPLKIRVQRDSAVLQNFIQFPPTEVMTVTIQKYHINDTPTPEVATIWRGRVLGANWKGSEAQLDCEPVFTSLKRPGLRRRYQAQCPHVLYGPKCKVNGNAFAVTDTLTGVASAVVTAPGFAISADYFFGGYLVFDNREFRTIIADDGAGNLTMAYALSELEIGSQVQVFPGCGHDLLDCENKFNNLDNYGGFPFVPLLNPFGGTPIY